MNDFLVSDQLPKGLGLKKLSGNIYELRVDIGLRVILTETIRVSNIIEAEQHPEGRALKDTNDYLRCKNIIDVGL